MDDDGTAGTYNAGSLNGIGRVALADLLPGVVELTGAALTKMAARGAATFGAATSGLATAGAAGAAASSTGTALAPKNERMLISKNELR